MVIIGQELSGFTIVAALDSPTVADAYRAVDTEENEVTLYLQEHLTIPVAEFTDEIDQLLLLSRAMHGVVPVLCGGVLGTVGWLATPALLEPPLEGLLSRYRPLAFDIVADAGRILCGAHALGLIHGDLGPHNVVITRAGVTMLKAFGFHRAFGVTSDEEAEGACYRAPELLDGRPIDVRTDVYGLGTLLYALLTGRASSPKRAERGPLEPLSGLPDGVGLVLARALASDPDARFQTIDDFTVALRPFTPAANAPVAEISLSNPSPAPDTVKTAPVPPSRDTLPTGTAPPGATRHPIVRVLDLRRRRQLLYAVGALGIAALMSSAAMLFLAPQGPAPAGSAVSFPATGAAPIRPPASAPPRAEAAAPTAPLLAPASQSTSPAALTVPQAAPKVAPINRQTKVPVTTDENSRDATWYSTHY